MQASDYNNYPPYVEEEINKFKNSKKAVVFRLLNIREDEDNPGQLLLPTYRNIEYKDYVRRKNPDTGEYDSFHIAYIVGRGADGQATLGRDIVWGRFNAGNLVCDPSRPKDAQKYAYLLLSNFNKTNPHRDQGIQAEYEEVRPTEQAKMARENRKHLRDAMNKASDLTDGQVEDIFSVISNRDPRGISLEEKFDMIEQYASDHPVEFMKMYESRYVAIEAFINKALKLRVITNDNKKGVFFVQDKPIVEYKVGQQDPTPKELLAHKLLEDQKLLTKIETLVEVEE